MAVSAASASIPCLATTVTIMSDGQRHAGPRIEDMRIALAAGIQVLFGTARRGDGRMAKQQRTRASLDPDFPAGARQAEHC